MGRLEVKISMGRSIPIRPCLRPRSCKGLSLIASYAERKRRTYYMCCVLNDGRTAFSYKTKIQFSTAVQFPRGGGDDNNKIKYRYSFFFFGTQINAVIVSCGGHFLRKRTKTDTTISGWKSVLDMSRFRRTRHGQKDIDDGIKIVRHEGPVRVYRVQTSVDGKAGMTMMRRRATTTTKTTTTTTTDDNNNNCCAAAVQSNDGNFSVFLPKKNVRGREKRVRWRRRASK